MLGIESFEFLVALRIGVAKRCICDGMLCKRQIFFASSVESSITWCATAHIVVFFKQCIALLLSASNARAFKCSFVQRDCNTCLIRVPLSRFYFCLVWFCFLFFVCRRWCLVLLFFPCIRMTRRIVDAYLTIWNFEIRIVASIRNNYTRYSCCKQELRRECDFRSSSLGSPIPFGWLRFFHFFLAWLGLVSFGFGSTKVKLGIFCLLVSFRCFFFFYFVRSGCCYRCYQYCCVWWPSFILVFFRWPYAMTYKNAS